MDNSTKFSDDATLNSIFELPKPKKPTKTQLELLRDIAIQQQFSGSGFTLNLKASGPEISFLKGGMLHCEKQDVEALIQANFLRLSGNENGQISGEVNPRILPYLFGGPALGDSYGEPLSLAGIPPGTRAHELLSECHSWAEERVNFLLSDALSNMPLENAPVQEFLNSVLKIVADQFDIWAEAFLRISAMTQEATEAFKHHLEQLENAALAKYKDLPAEFLDARTWKQELGIQLNSRKQYWMGHRRKGVREYWEKTRGTEATKDASMPSGTDAEAERQAATTAPKSIRRGLEGIDRWIDVAGYSNAVEIVRPSSERWNLADSTSTGGSLSADAAEVQATSRNAVLSPLPRSSAQSLPKRRGRPQIISDEKKSEAVKMKAEGKTNRDIAAVIYETKHPSHQQKKNVPSILRHFNRKAKVTGASDETKQSTKS